MTFNTLLYNNRFKANNKTGWLKNNQFERQSKSFKTKSIISSSIKLDSIKCLKRLSHLKSKTERIAKSNLRLTRNLDGHGVSLSQQHRISNWRAGHSLRGACLRARETRLQIRLFTFRLSRACPGKSSSFTLTERNAQVSTKRPTVCLCVRYIYPHPGLLDGDTAPARGAAA